MTFGDEADNRATVDHEASFEAALSQRATS